MHKHTLFLQFQWKNYYSTVLCFALLASSCKATLLSTVTKFLTQQSAVCLKGTPKESAQ